MEGLLQRQEIIAEAIQKISTNFKKDAASRKTTEYVKKRISALQNLWGEFEANHIQLTEHGDINDDYFQSKAYASVRELYTATFDLLMHTLPGESSIKEGDLEKQQKHQLLEEQDPQGTFCETGTLSKTDELISQQRTNFRALSRAIRGIDIDNLQEKWEIEDKLQTLQNRWKTIDELHWKIDNLLIGSEIDYEQDYAKYEDSFESTKRQLNQKLNGSKHLKNIPKLEIPVFSGNYGQWPTFRDLYSEAIHNNLMLSKPQKMQHLKGKLRGEPERLVQHLNISSENYDTCWEIITRRYNNKQLLFTRQMQTFMSQSHLQKHTAFELKRLHDVTVETIHAIQNLGVDTSSWDPILVHIVTEKMDPETYTSYMDYRKNPRDIPSFKELIEYLESKFNALEPLNKTYKGKTVGTSKPQHKQENQYKEFSSKHVEPSKSNYKPYTRSYYAKAERKCPVCKLDHILIYCKTFLDMSPNNKLKTISQSNICENCLYCHNGKQCNSTKTCKVCNKNHHTTLHDIISDKATANTTPKKPTDSERNTSHVQGKTDEVLLATLELNVLSIDGTPIKLRCLLDQGSQVNLITESAAQRLGLRRQRQHAKISGIGITSSKCLGMLQLQCESLYNNYNFTIDAMIMSKMINNLPNYTFTKPDWPHLRNIDLADPNYNISRPIDILLDAEVYAEIIMDGILRGPMHSPIAQQTKVGWVLLGSTKTFQCNAVLTNIEEISQFWEMEDITQPESILTSEEQYCETLYQETTTRGIDGRYSVRIPMKKDFEQHLGSSKPQAIAQFYQIEKKLSKNFEVSESYKDFIREYLQLDHMRECKISREPSCYLPHHSVMKLDSQTTKLRVVFNASSKTSSGYSLNELMECGPNLQKDIQSLIIRWRSFRFVFTTDIEKFYRQVRIQEQDENLQKIVWRDNTTLPLKEYTLCTITYGFKAAAYLALRTIKQLIKDDGEQYPLAANTLENQIYVDDILGGSNSLKQAKLTQSQVIELLRGGGFKLRKWASNHPELLKNLSQDQISQNMLDFKHAATNKTLGISWNPCTDQFTFQRAKDLNPSLQVTTKRSLLSDLSKLYDPLGWLSPVTIKAKLIFQQLWTMKLDWDSPLPKQVQEEWDTFKTELKYITDINIPRWVGDTSRPIELHGFCDSSERAFAAIVYCKSFDENDKITIQILAAKTRLAPLNKTITLPRCELSAAYLLSKLMTKVIESFSGQTVTLHGWTDSMIVLGWLKGDMSRWKTFVANRVAKVLGVMPASCWKHVSSQENPADCASRGILPSQLINHKLWWKGPAWLVENRTPYQPERIELPSLEQKSKQVCAAQPEFSVIEDLLNKHSSMTRVIRIVAWILRVNKNKDSTTRLPYLSAGELEFAHNAIIRAVQHKHFYEDILSLQKKGQIQRNSRMLNLYPHLDSNNILRVGGRLRESNLNEAQRHLIILPHNDRLTVLLIELSHKTTLHGGVRLTLSHLRNKYWILRGVQTVKYQLLKCVRCHRFKTSNSNQLMANLPRPRVTPSRAFTHTGVDFTGQVEVKASRGRGIKTNKAYIVIFVCMSTKAVHIDLVSDLSTAAFLCALKRFCARRGTPKCIYSDNGTNFVGAAKILIKEHNEALSYYINSEILSEINTLGIEWKFNAPAWASCGGLWEASVKSLKFHLKRVLGDQKLTFEEFSTLIAQIEGCLNSRPLIALTEDIDNLDYLTPGHFLVGGPLISSPLSPEENIRNIKSRWQMVEMMHKHFWKRWSAEYLQTLQVRGKWHLPTKNLTKGDIVLVKDENLPPSKWLLGRITDTHPGKDGHVRVVTLKTKTNTLKRPITKVSRLPIEQEESKEKRNDQSTSVNFQQKHNTKNRKLYSYLCTWFMVLLCSITPTTQQLVNVTQFQPGKPLYFDKIADMQLEQDTWRMVIYYNMSNYWRNLQVVEVYVDILGNLYREGPALSSITSITSQLKQEISEIQYYNQMLKAEHENRFKRGLINGVGYAASYLFGVLDQNFAEQYNKDIQMLQSNEKHLQHLYKQQTSIIEGEHNVIKRNEEIMNEQFRLISKHIQNYDGRLEQLGDILAKAFAANLLVSNLRRTQQLLLDLITDIKGGRIDAHLLRPSQLEEQLNIISGQLPSELSLPCVNSLRCMNTMYKLSRVHAKLIEDFFIFEVKLPLVSNERYELNKMLPIPHKAEQMLTYIITTTDYLAVNLKKDIMIPMNEEDVVSCTHLENHQLLCPAHLPIYNIKLAETICEAEIINNKNLSTCRTAISSCTDKWTQLHSGAWLYLCCKNCTMRIFCTSGTKVQYLNGSGIIELAPGCMMKGDDIVIHSHYNLRSNFTVNIDEVAYIPESGVNNLIYSSKYTFQAESHGETMKALKEKIEEVKKYSDTLEAVTVSHDTHRYILYCLITAIIFGAGLGCIRLLRRRFERSLHLEPINIELQSKTCQNIEELVIETPEGSRGARKIKLDKGTSPARNE